MVTADKIVKNSSGWALGLWETAMARLWQSRQPEVPIPRRALYLERYETFDVPRILSHLYNNSGYFLSNDVSVRYISILHTEKAFFSDLSGLSTPEEVKKRPFEVAKLIEGVGLTVIPYDHFGHHIVIVIDPKQKRVEYYDPKGATSLAPESQKGQFKMREELEAISAHFFNGEGVIVENITQQQSCLFRCGIWGLYYIEERVKGFSMEEIVGRPLTSADMDRYKIEVVARKIEEHAERILAKSD